MHTTTADPAAAAFVFPEYAGLPAGPVEGAALNPTPRWRDVLREQFAAVGLALRREGLVAAGVATLFTGFVVYAQVQKGLAEIPLTPSAGVAAAIMALLIPMAVWKGEDPARRGYHRAMPVSHAAHAVARTAAGLAWTLAATVGFFAWLGLLSALTGGAVSVDAPWRWMAPFAGVTVMYLLGSALTLTTSHPWRWLGGSVVGYVFVNVFRGVTSTAPLVDTVNAALQGRYSLRTVLTGMAQAGGKWRLQPDFGVWLTATWIWLAVAVAVFLWSAHRQPER